MCPRGSLAVCASTVSAVAAHFRRDCDCWSCRTCRRKIIDDNIFLLTNHFEKSGMVYVIRGTAAEWSAVRQRMRRAGVAWVKIWQSDATWTVYADGDAARGGMWLDPSKALRDADTLLNAIRRPAGFLGRFMPVSTCREWRKARKASKWRFLGLATAESFRREAARLGSAAVEVVRHGVSSLRAAFSQEAFSKLFEHFGRSPQTPYSITRKAYKGTAFTPASSPAEADRINRLLAESEPLPAFG